MSPNIFGIFLPFRSLSGAPLQPNGPEAHLGRQEGGAGQFGELVERSFASGQAGVRNLLGTCCSFEIAGVFQEMIARARGPANIERQYYISS